MRGILGKKIGMTQVFDDDNRLVPVTVIDVAGCRAGQVKTTDRDGYASVQLCLGEARKKKVGKPEVGHATKHGIEPPRFIVELAAGAGDGYEPGQEIKADIFAAGEKVDVVGVSRGKGHAGVMKRHGFAGLKASHGTHRAHRHPGAIGMAATPAHVLKGMRMSGHMGHKRTTIQNLTVVEADAERGLILVKGAVPGPNGRLVMVRDPAKHPARKGPR